MTPAQEHLQHLARAAEHLVASDILQRGYACSFAAASLRYDLIAEVGGLRRVQVKMTQKPYCTKTTIRGKSYSTTLYTFSPGQSRSGIEFRMSDYAGKIDLFAFVAMDLRCILYVMPEVVKTNKMYIKPSEFTAARTAETWISICREFAPSTPQRGPNLGTGIGIH